MPNVNQTAKLTLVLNQPNNGLDYDYEIEIENDYGLNKIVNNLRWQGIKIIDCKTTFKDWDIIETFDDCVKDEIDIITKLPSFHAKIKTMKLNSGIIG